MIPAMLSAFQHGTDEKKFRWDSPDIEHEVGSRSTATGDHRKGDGCAWVVLMSPNHWTAHIDTASGSKER